MKIDSKKAEDLLNLITLVGFVTFLAGLVLSMTTEGWFRLAVGLLVGGGVVAVLSYLLSLGAKKAIITINVALMILFAFIILVVVNYVNSRHYRRFDWTQGGRHQLNSRTINIISNLKDRVTIWTLFKPMNDLQYYTFASLKDLLEEYRYNSRNLEVRHVDPIYDSTGVQRLATQLKIDEVQLNSVIVQCGTKYKQISMDELIQQDWTPYRNPYQPSEPPKFKGEEVVTAAIINVTEAKQTTIYFTTGHGERDFDDYDERRGMSELAKVLKRDNYKLEKVNLFEKKAVPDDCDLLVIAGPIKTFAEDEITAIRNYLSKNGKLLIMLEPMGIAKQQQPSGLESLLSEYGVKVNTGVVVLTPIRGIGVLAQTFVGGDKGYPYSKITEKMRNEVTIFPFACQVDSTMPEGEPGASGSHKVNVLCKSSEMSWGETEFGKTEEIRFDESKDIRGPIALAVSVEPKPPEQPNPYGGPPMPRPDEKVEGPRMVVFGSASFAANVAINSSPGNQDLVLNCVGWLAAKETQLGIAAKPFDVRPITVTPQAAKVIFAFAIIVMPVVGGLAGVVVWLIRRK